LTWGPKSEKTVRPRHRGENNCRSITHLLSRPYTVNATTATTAIATPALDTNMPTDTMANSTAAATIMASETAAAAAVTVDDGCGRVYYRARCKAAIRLRCTRDKPRDE